MSSDTFLLSSEISLNIIENLNSLEDVQNFCSINKSNYDLCKRYRQTVCKSILNVMKVDKAPLESYRDIGGLEDQI